MRLLHVSDWHLGRRTRRASRAPDHDAVLAEMVAIARDVRPDLILHTGDLWDGARPAYEDLTRGIDALRALSESAPVAVIAGNHDSPALFRALGGLPGVSERILFIHRARPEPYEFACADGDVIRLAALPFVHENRAVAGFEHHPSEWGAAYADRAAKIWGVLETGLRHREDPGRHVAVLACHLHVLEARFSRSERPITVSDAYAAAPARLPPVGYAAFGHIHRPQALPGGMGRYAGSPIPLDFGEEDEDKSVVLVEARPRRRADARTIPLTGGRPLLRIDVEGTAGLAPVADRARGALCSVMVRSEEPIPRLADLVSEALPGAVLLDVENHSRHGRLEAVRDTAEGAHEDEASLPELFAEFLRAGEVGGGASAAGVRDRFLGILAAVEAEVDWVPDELPALTALPDDTARPPAGEAPE